jgi:hypothetical protein
LPAGLLTGLDVVARLIAGFAASWLSGRRAALVGFGL